MVSQNLSFLLPLGFYSDWLLNNKAVELTQLIKTAYSLLHKYLYLSKKKKTRLCHVDTYAVHGGNLISIQLHTLTHRERHEEEKEEDRACSQRGGEKVKDMLVHARKEDVPFSTHLWLHFRIHTVPNTKHVLSRDKLCGKHILHFSVTVFPVSQQHNQDCSVRYPMLRSTNLYLLFAYTSTQVLSKLGFERFTSKSIRYR